MRSMIANAIDAASRMALRVGLGLRMPAAQIRINDLRKARDNAEQRADMAALETHYWITEEQRLSACIEDASDAFDDLHTRRMRLSVPAPTRPIGDL